jgi:large subunit ribosomal protein L13
LKTYVTKQEDINRQWYLINAEGCVLGRLASLISDVLRGKNKPIFSPEVDCGDYVVVVNAEKIVLTGKKLKQKVAWTHSGYPGGLKLTLYDKLMAEKPEEALKRAVKGMLPHNKLRDRMLKKLKIYKGPAHEQEAQNPQPFNLPKRIKIT